MQGEKEQERPSTQKIHSDCLLHVKYSIMYEVFDFKRIEKRHISSNGNHHDNRRQSKNSALDVKLYLMAIR